MLGVIKMPIRMREELLKNALVCVLFMVLCICVLLFQYMKHYEANRSKVDSEFHVTYFGTEAVVG